MAGHRRVYPHAVADDDRHVSPPKQGVCSPWASAADVCSPCDDYTFPEGLLTECIAAASDVLYELSGRRYAGTCEDTVRPTLHDFMFDHWRWGMGAEARYGIDSGPVLGWCNYVPEVLLGGYPVTGITEVLIDGAVVDPATYRVDDWRTLVRVTDPATNTNGGWPCCQDMASPATEQGTFEVTFTYGVMPPAMGVRAAARLGCELALACSPESGPECQLPERVTTVARQGVTAVILDPFAFLEQGRTGLYDVDLFLAAANPGGLNRRGTATSTRSRRTRPRRAGTS